MPSVEIISASGGTANSTTWPIVLIRSPSMRITLFASGGPPKPSINRPPTRRSWPPAASSWRRTTPEPTRSRREGAYSNNQKNRSVGKGIKNGARKVFGKTLTDVTQSEYNVGTLNPLFPINIPRSIRVAGITPLSRHVNSATSRVFPKTNL